MGHTRRVTDDDERESPAPAPEEGRAGIRRVAGPARDALASVAAAAEPLVGRIGEAVEGVERSLGERPGMRIRRVRRRAANPLPYLNQTHPDVRLAHPVQVGLRTIPVDAIAGTAVGGGDQRGGDFLPLKPFRGRNWAGRWQRLSHAQNELAILPPIEVVKHGGRYWVIDGHNRVASALYNGQPEIDATIVELVPPGERRTEPVVELASTLSGSRTLRTRAEGRPASGALAHEDRLGPDRDAS
jgi:ParB/Sulfiredoxin domain